MVPSGHTVDRRQSEPVQNLKPDPRGFEDNVHLGSDLSTAQYIYIHVQYSYTFAITQTHTFAHHMYTHTHTHTLSSC